MLDFLADLERFEAESFVHWQFALERLQVHGTDIGMPHWKWLGDGFGEIRWKCGRKRPRIFCTEESNGRVVMLDYDARKLIPFIPRHRMICRRNRDDFRSEAYSQTARRIAYNEKHENNVRTR